MQGGVIYEDLTVHQGITLQNTCDMSERGTVAGRCLVIIIIIIIINFVLRG